MAPPVDLCICDVGPLARLLLMVGDPPRGGEMQVGGWGGMGGGRPPPPPGSPPGTFGSRERPKINFFDLQKSLPQSVFFNE